MILCDYHMYLSLNLYVAIVRKDLSCVQVHLSDFDVFYPKRGV